MGLLDVPGISKTAANSLYVGKDAQLWNVKDHGAVGDGTTNDLAAINTLISNVSTAGGGVVYFPRSTYRVNGAILLKSNVTMRGDGWGSVISLGANVNGYGVILISNISNASVRDLKVLGNSATYTSVNAGIYQRSDGAGSTDIVIENVWVDQIAYIGIGIIGDSTRTTVSSGFRIDRCKTTNTGGHGIIIQAGVDNAHIRFCTVNTYGQTYTDTPGITNGRYAYNTSMVGNTVDGTGSTGSSAHCISLDTPYGGAVVSQNNTVNGVGYGIELGYATDATCVSNVVRACTYGINITSNGALATNGTAYGVTVSGNTVSGCTGPGITNFMGSPSANVAAPASRTTLRSSAYGAIAIRVIEGRRLYLCSAGGTTAATKPAALGASATGDSVTDGTMVWVDQGSTNARVTVAGNTVHNCGGTGIAFTYMHLFNISGNTVTENGLSGIFIDSSCNMYSITGNDLQGNNATATAGHGNLKIIAYNGGAYNVLVDGNRLSHSGLANTDLFIINSVSSASMTGRFLPNLTQPSVAFEDYFFTQNTAATSINALADPNRTTRFVTVHVNDSFTTFVHSTSGGSTLRLAGGVNFVAPLGTVIQFAYQYSQLQWIEVSRSTIDTTLAVVSKTATYTILPSDGTVLCNGTFTATLPSAVTVGAGKTYVVKNTGSGTITIGSTAGTIDGASTATISAQYASVKVQSDGTNWWTIL